MKTLILIAQLSTGALEWQAMPAEICRNVIARLALGEAVTGVRDDGSEVLMIAGQCEPDDLLTRLALGPATYGDCGQEEGV